MNDKYVYVSRFAIGETVLYDGAPARVTGVTFVECKVLYDLDAATRVLERVDSCDVHPLPTPPSYATVSPEQHSL